MNAGYAQRAITPALDRPVYLAGFGHNRRAQGIHDELYARALALRTDSTTLVLTALDLIGFFRADVLDVARRVQREHPDAHIIIAATHTHHGPDTLGLWGPDDRTRGTDANYMSFIKEQLVEVILASLSDLQPATASWASVAVPGTVRNARDPEIVDDELTLLQFMREAGSPACITLFNFPCHPEVLWEHNTDVTSDYVHYLRQEVEQQTHGACLFFAGALGGMLTPAVHDHSFEEAEAMGRMLAQVGLQALQAVQGRQNPDLHVRKKEIQAKLTNPLYKLAFWRKLLPDARDGRGQVHSEVSLVKIGGLWFAAVPGELLPRLGLRLKSWLRALGAQVAGVIGLANDELGYILPVEDFKYPWNPFRPGKHYEETNSIGREVAPRVMEAFKELIEHRGEAK